VALSYDEGLIRAEPPPVPPAAETDSPGGVS